MPKLLIERRLKNSFNEFAAAGYNCKQARKLGLVVTAFFMSITITLKHTKYKRKNLIFLLYSIGWAWPNFSIFVDYIYMYIVYLLKKHGCQICSQFLLHCKRIFDRIKPFPKSSASLCLFTTESVQFTRRTKRQTDMFTCILKFDICECMHIIGI